MEESGGTHSREIPSFNENYRILKEAADWLSRQEEPDIDQLVPRVEQAMRAYQACKERLSAVQQALGQFLGEPEGHDKNARRRPAPQSGVEDGPLGSLNELVP